MLKGRATPEATQVYAGTHGDVEHRPLGDTDLLVSPAGFGGYRVNASSSIFHEALSQALCHGVNVIDTSSNYADGGSEALVGTVVRELHDDERVSREAVVVVSKGGYLQGQNYEISQQRKEAGRPFPDLVEYAEGLEHCIHPEFLEDQLTRSLRRLEMETLDVYLLHNPEYYLTWAAKQDQPLQEARQEYYRRIGLAFEHLEEEVAQGRIQYYGISSNTFPVPDDDPGHTSLSRVWEIAQNVSEDNHFRVVQLPANLLETGAMTTANQPDEETVVSFARRHDLAVLVNRPLNAIQDDRLVRLADVEVSGEASLGRVAAAISRLTEVEKRFSSDIRSLLEAEQEEIVQLADIFTVGRFLQARWRTFGAYHNWNEVQTRFLVPRVQSAVEFLMKQSETVQDWVREYARVFNEALRAVDAVYAAEVANESQAIKQAVTEIDDDWAQAETLSQMAVRALRSTAGVTTVLVGMRRPRYVDDVLAELRHGVDVEERDAAWQALAEADFGQT